MITEQLKKDIITAVLGLERNNVNNGYPKTKDQMISEIEKIIIEVVDSYENQKNKA